MFEIAELDHEIAKDEYETRSAELRERLLDAQFDMRERGKQAVLVVTAGVDAGGKSETIQLLHGWLDPRHIRTRAFVDDEQDHGRPPFWRYWRELPARGLIGVVFHSWYQQPIEDRAFGGLRSAKFDRAMDDIRRFEQMLSGEQFVLLKLWFHLSKRDQHDRLRALEKNKLTRWRVRDEDWQHHDQHEQLVEVATRALRTTSTDFAPWIIVPGKNERYRSLVVGQALLDAMRNEEVTAPSAEPAVHPVPPIDGLHVLQTLDLSRRLEKPSYDRELEQWQGRLATLVRRKKFAKRTLLAVFEGVDAAGKGGAIRRVTAALDPRTYDVIPIAAPTDEERARPYLWRFWRHLPPHGRVLLFDRSWYGRVLVERVENFCTSSDWLRAYGEINDFEEQLVEHGVVLVKLWLQIDQGEQLRRFDERKQHGHKRWKITEDDWRNREKWSHYEQAVTDMIDRTSTEVAPWTLVEANDKHFARIKVLRTICERLEKELR